MQTPVEIDFQGMSGTPEVHASIEKHVAELLSSLPLYPPSSPSHIIFFPSPVAKSMLGEPRRRTSAKPICHLPSMMPSSMRDADCRIMFAACRDR